MHDRRKKIKPGLVSTESRINSPGRSLDLFKSFLVSDQEEPTNRNNHDQVHRRLRLPDGRRSGRHYQRRNHRGFTSSANPDDSAIDWRRRWAGYCRFFGINSNCEWTSSRHRSRRTFQ